MSTSTVSSKGQIVIPSAVRQDMAVEAGTRVEFVKTAEGWLLKPATLPVTALKGLVKRKPAKPVSIEDMDLAIRKRARRLFLSR
ncbi:MAG: AbrB/MazE/SpoVT family DNA-binding domain-containing protein [Caldimonas sp.]